MVIEAHAIRAVHAWRSWLGLALAGVLIGSNILIVPVPALLPTSVGRNLFGGAVETGSDALRLGLVKSELGGYAFELTHACRGPDEELVSFVEGDTAKEDLIGITHDGLAVMFHTRRAFAGVLSPETRKRPGWNGLPSYLWDIGRARWLILRPERFGSEGASAADLLGTLRLEGVRVEKSFHLDIEDVRWINNPLVSQHVFRPPKGTEGVDILLLARPTE
jgi:hypothetical protein